MSAIEILFAALNAEFGVVVESEDVERLKQRLSVARAKDPQFAVLSICTSPFAPTSQIWIVKNERPTD